jgi:hypothetical protein
MISSPLLTIAAILLALAAAYRVLCWLDDVADYRRHRRQQAAIELARANAALRERSQIGARRLP